MKLNSLILTFSFFILSSSFVAGQTSGINQDIVSKIKKMSPAKDTTAIEKVRRKLIGKWVDSADARDVMIISEDTIKESKGDKYSFISQYSLDTNNRISVYYTDDPNGVGVSYRYFSVDDKYLKMYETEEDFNNRTGIELFKRVNK